MSVYGFSKVSIAMLARDAGIQSSTLYKHYLNKEHILDDIIRLLESLVHFDLLSCEQVREMLREQSPSELLKAFCSYPKGRRPLVLQLCRIIYRGTFTTVTTPKIPQIMERLWEQYEQSMRSLLEALVQCRAIPPADTATLSEIWARVRYLFNIWHSHDEYAYVSHYNDVVQLFIDMVVKGVSLPEIGELSLPRLESTPIPPIESTKDKIRYAAFLLFCEQGFEKTTVSQIAKRAGISPSGIYNHYPGKESLLLVISNAIKDAHAAPPYRSYREIFNRYAQSRDVRELVTDLCSGYCYTFGEDTKRAYRFLLHEQFRTSDMRYYFQGSVNEDRSMVASSLRDLIAAGACGECDYYSLATMYIFLQCSINIQCAFLEPSPQEITDFKIRAYGVLAGVIAFGIGADPPSLKG